MKFRKKPVEIEAIQWNGAGIDPMKPRPQWLIDALYKNPPDPGFMMRMGDEIHIGTLEGVMIAKPGDWIIRGIKGELYPCKPDIFAASYDPV